MPTFSRREMLISSMSITAIGDAFGQASAVPKATQDLSVAADQWMTNALQTRAATTTLNFSRFADPIYFLLKPIGWKPGKDQPQLKPVTARAGFVTDLASVPQPFWSLLRPDGDYAYAAILHDYLYWTQERPKEEADTILKLAMEDFDVQPVKVAAIYEAVKRLGDSAWKSNAAAKAKGERRFLSLYPADPTIRWAAWKLNPNVFGS